jgi:probable HAF family extracellular repeat protein
VPAQYAVTGLDTLGGNYGQALDINEAGQVVGYAATGDGINHAFLWNNGTMIDLGTLGGDSVAWSIDDLGQVVGTTTDSGDGSNHVFRITPQGGVWFRDSNLDGRNDLMIDLGTVNGSPADMNNAGQAVFYSGTRSFLWDPINGTVELVTPPGIMFCAAIGINDAGQVTGMAAQAGGPWSAFLWDVAHGMTLLGAGPYYESVSCGINDVGQVAGARGDQAFLWTPDSPNGLTGTFTDLGTFWGGNWSESTALNNVGHVVGLSTGPEVCDEYGCYRTPSVFIWSPADGMLDLQGQLLPGSNLTLVQATAINDDGVIAVTAINNWTGQSGGFLLTPVPPGTPSIRIADSPAVLEGNVGTVAATFTVTLSAPGTEAITVAYTTGNGTAVAAGDYQAASGTLTFAPGQTEKTITVLINGDRLGEPNETFVVNLSNPTNATIADGQGVGTVIDDEPRISISDVTKQEGKKGKTTLFTFTVTLSVPYDQAVTMSFRTANGTATTSSNDYVARTGTLTFAPGEMTKTITIEVKGDGKRESNEYFYLDLSDNSSNSWFSKNRGLGTILNDD